VRAVQETYEEYWIKTYMANYKLYRIFGAAALILAISLILFTFYMEYTYGSDDSESNHSGNFVAFYCAPTIVILILVSLGFFKNASENKQRAEWIKQQHQLQRGARKP
jgi:fumarate reductase subunit C